MRLEEDVRLTRAHLEEDAGKSLHEDYHGMTGIDLNRAGTPLLEIVSEPDLRSADEAVAYAKKLHQFVTWHDICDGNMQEGSFRCDANVSVRPAGQREYGTRCEIKNLNSFAFMEKAIEFEVRRQIALIEDGGKVVQETRLYDPVDERDAPDAQQGRRDGLSLLPRSGPAAADHRRGVDRTRAGAMHESPMCAARASSTSTSSPSTTPRC
jgi:Asp-tRNA(Asn)/Glu-tRNA(Gln) amidotransferase B subunit